MICYSDVNCDLVRKDLARQIQNFDINFYCKTGSSNVVGKNKVMYGNLDSDKGKLYRHMLNCKDIAKYNYVLLMDDTTFIISSLDRLFDYECGYNLKYVCDVIDSSTIEKIALDHSLLIFSGCFLNGIYMNKKISKLVFDIVRNYYKTDGKIEDDEILIPSIFQKISKNVNVSPYIAYSNHTNTSLNQYLADTNVLMVQSPNDILQIRLFQNTILF
jgi:hypothetical protein